MAGLGICIERAVGVAQKLSRFLIVEKDSDIGLASNHSHRP